MTERIEGISTRWSAIHDVDHFVARYSNAVLAYLRAFLGPNEADDVAQDLFLEVARTGFTRASPDRGRFRDYLKTITRNAALTYLRKQSREPKTTDANALQHTVDDADAQDAWLSDWRACLLNRAWAALEDHERRSPGNLFWTVLRLSVDHADEDSATLADRASAIAGRAIRADAFRQQLRGARLLFARLIVREVVVTLDEATPTTLEEELAETGLLLHVLPFLPADWREQPLDRGST